MQTNETPSPGPIPASTEAYMSASAGAQEPVSASIEERMLDMVEPALVRRQKVKAERCSYPLDTREVYALIKYAVEKGLDREGTVIPPLMRWLEARDALRLSRSAEPAAPDEVTEQEALGTGPLQNTGFGNEVLKYYGRLVRLTSPVTGRTVLQTERQFQRSVLPLHTFTLFILLLVIGNEVFKLWVADMVLPEDGPLLTMIEFRGYLFDVCAPFLWGALGACVWLLKRLSDVAEDKTFDATLARGWTTRILLGAILGGMVQYLYDPQVFSAGSFKLGASAIGFLTGVGVKIVYGAIEKLIEVLVDKMNIDAARQPAQPAVIRDFLSAELNKTNKAQEPDRYALLVELIDKSDDSKAAR